MATMEEIKKAYDFAVDAMEIYQKEGRDIPISFFERVLSAWQETINLCKADEAQTFYVYEFEGEQTTVNKDGCEVWPFFNEVASVIAMSDCSDQNVVKIVFQGKEFHYTGWKPGMEFTFVDDENSQNAYTTWMPHLDH